MIILHVTAYPDYDGGSPVTEFEVQIINPDNSSRLVYRGRELECVVAGLSPGQLYQFQTRAFNRAGVRLVLFLFSFNVKPLDGNFSNILISLGRSMV